METFIFLLLIVFVIYVVAKFPSKNISAIKSKNAVNEFEFLQNPGGAPFYFIFDTETSGLPSYSTDNYKDLDAFPRIIQIAYLVFDEDEYLIEKNNSYLNIEANISPGALKVHGISQKKLYEIGKSPKNTYDNIVNWIKQSKVIVMHNEEFDLPILKSELHRFGYNVKEIFEDKQTICTMKESIKFVGITHKGSGLKYPKLSELYGKIFYRNPYVQYNNAHNAYSDAYVLARCFFQLAKLGEINLSKVQERINNSILVKEYIKSSERIQFLHNENFLLFQMDFSAITNESNSSNLPSPKIEWFFPLPWIKKTKSTIEIIQHSTQNDILQLDFRVYLSKYIPSKYPEIKELRKTINWIDFSQSQYFEMQGKAISSFILKVSKDIFSSDDKINEIKMKLFDFSLNPAKGVDEDQKIIEISVNRTIFEEINLPKVNPLDTISLFSTKMKFLKTKGFQPIKN